ncbi:hypothetical protein NW754_007928 [Fusarium falciforme]|uniref:Ubiquitin-like domain-containing protein n=1 Tax=Fusarium falciforme TaxID=195108 RepID=A0A9W8QT59_9HYPO|nr:hypothetical protein NW754_007928 [Fusarium falciforme]KAJ4178398.1 hypothetical protein NW755_013237 [Fusarium falciforme]KAJ4183004.1 hypothetical protein NW767_013684 [Fusarium falciforme]KAJ4246476.1 hypothetical protein NW757_009525 [Fusarium falciforme]
MEHEEIGDAHISVRFKHGIHTIYLFVDSLEPFSNVTTQLLDVLTERYPNGLTTSIAPPKTTTVTEGTILAYGALKNANDPTAGWKKLKIGNGDTPTRLGLKNNSLIAFAVVDDEDEDPVFEVEWPREDEELYEQQ